MGKQADRANRFFASELSTLKQETRSWILQIFDEVCPDYFWERPAAKRGGYHPAFADGPRRARSPRQVRLLVGQGILSSVLRQRQRDDTGPLYDVVIAALIIHDIVKDGDEKRTIPKAPEPMGKYHGVEMMEALFHRVLGGKEAHRGSVVDHGRGGSAHGRLDAAREVSALES
jgi:hypothetical protein